MKAKHIRKIREKIRKWHRYDVKESAICFGSPFEKKSYTFLARSPEHAVEKYLRWYMRKHRTYSRHHTNCPSLCYKRDCASFEVYDIDGDFKYYIKE